MNWQTLCMTCMQDDSGAAVCPHCGGPFDLPPKNTLQLKPRSVLNEQYVVGRALGHGGFGVTYLAWDTIQEKRFAVKEYLPNGVAGRGSGETRVSPYSEQVQQEFDWGLERFLAEARTLQAFSNCEGIVAIDTIFRANGTAYLVMEFLDGWTLEEFLKRRGGKITFEIALRVMLPVIDALCAIHAEGVLHRDISPDNIYLTRAGKVKLIDFGAARNALGQKSRNLSIILKEGYAPEEQYRASGIQGPWTDVYAAAATMYHAVTGKIPQPALDRLAEDKLNRPSELGIEIDHDAERALMMALALKSPDRFQSMEDFKSVLTGSASITAMMRAMHRDEPAVKIDPPPAPPVSPPVPPLQSLPPVPPVPPPAPLPKTAPRWIVPAALALVALIAIVIAMHPWRKPVPPDDNNNKKISQVVTPDNSQKDQTQQQTDQQQQQQQQPAHQQTSKPDEERKKAGPYIPPPKPRPDQVITPPDQQQQQQPQQQPPPPPPDQQQQQQQQQFPEQQPPFSRGGPSSRPAGDYESLIEQAKFAWTARQFPQVQNLLNQAIRLDPSKPRAFSGLAELQLYVFNDFSDAAQNAQKAIANGGEAVFHLRHDHSGETFTVQCTGKLYISRNGIRFVPDTGGHSFTARKTEVREAKRNRMLSLHIGRQQNTVDLHPFHIRLANGENFNFAGESRSTDAERDLILTFLGEH